MSAIHGVAKRRTRLSDWTELRMLHRVTLLPGLCHLVCCFKAHPSCCIFQSFLLFL